MAFGEGAGPRLYLWRHAIEMFAVHPWLGVGIDGYAHALVGQLRAGEPMWGIDQYAHNLPLQLLATAGVAGFAAVAVPVLLFMRRILRARRGPEWFFGMGVLGILAIHSMLEQPLHYAYFLGIAAFVAGAMGSGGAAGTDWRRRQLRAGALVCVVFAGLVKKTAGDYRALADNFYGPERGDVGDERHLALLSSLHRTSLFAPMAELIAPALFVAGDAPVRERIAFNERVLRHAPVAEVAYRHAALLAEAGRQAEARAQFARAARAYPGEARFYADRLAELASRDLAFTDLARFAGTAAR